MSQTDIGEVLVEALHQRILDEDVLRKLWHMDAPWQSSGRMEAATVKLGKLLYRQAMTREAQLYGLRLRRTLIDGFRMAWLTNHSSKKQRGTLLLLHGLSAEKAHWLRFARYFVKDYRVLIVDLPAHGQTGYQAGRDYSTQAQAERILALLDYLNIDQAHVVGNSMGGFIAQRLACLAPKRVASLALFDAAGLPARSHSALETALRTERNPFLLHSLAEFDAFMGLAAYKLPWMPSQVRVMMARQYYERRERWFDIFMHMLREIYPHSWLMEQIGQIKMPTMVLWGEKDGLLDVDMLAHYEELLPHAQIVKLPNTGHLPMMERPARSARYYSEFLKNNFSLKRLAVRSVA
ncbi:MAG: alpha/beta hydrolase [Pseudomonadota bacterium]|nr:alpha/beta hydrolase [Pseudomonadota bacterium]